MNTFPGFERPDGSVGIRNHVAVLSSVSCANSVVFNITMKVPAAVPLYHTHGCGRGGKDLELHNRTLQNLCRHPNISGLLIIGLGCEIIKAEGLALAAALSKKPVEFLNIRDERGSKRTTAKGIKILKQFLKLAKKQKRKPVPLNMLKIGLECGGSNAFSGVTANPSIGKVSDWIVDQGGTAILTETTEMSGTTHILKKRAIDSSVAEKIESIINRTEDETKRVLGPIYKLVIAPGNMDGGMSTITEKSLGCIVKAGTKSFSGVYEYAELPDKKGLVIMNGPGYDSESITGLAAAGAQLIIFSTGNGSPLGFPIVPVIKVASTSELFEKSMDDMDFDAGKILSGMNIDIIGKELINFSIDVIKGNKTKAEKNNQNGIICLYTRDTSF